MLQRIKDWLWPGLIYDEAFEEYSRKRDGRPVKDKSWWSPEGRSPVPPYYELLHEACEASEEVDMFDVCSLDPISAAKFRGLCEDSDRAQLALISHVLANGAELQARFSEGR